MTTDDDFDLKPGMELLNGDDLILEFSDFKEEGRSIKYSKLKISLVFDSYLPERIRIFMRPRNVNLAAFFEYI